jgi:HPt (histidine-containing phosphotransfer) domain-containing protein
MTTSPATRKPTVFLDRDGTLNREVGFVSAPERIELLPGVAEALQRLVDHHGSDPAQLRLASLQGANDDIRRLCHVLKGVAGAVGAQALAASAARVEAGLAAQPGTELPTEPLAPGAVQALADQLQALLDGLAAALAAPPADDPGP